MTLTLSKIHKEIEKRTLCKKISAQIEREKELLKKYNYDHSKVERVVKFIERYIVHYKGEWAGKPLKMELWQMHIVASVFGIVDDKGKRVCREAFILIPRKHGKTLFAAALSLYMLLIEPENSPEVYVVANKFDQAKILFNDIYNITTKKESFKKYIKKNRKEIANIRNLGIMKPLASDSDTLDGLNTFFAVMDEVHAMKNMNLYGVIDSSTGARREPLICMITTNGVVRGRTFDIIYEEYSRILLGIVEDDARFAFIYELDDKEEIHDKNMWIKANPGIEFRETLLNYVESQYSKALQSDAQMKLCLTKTFNLPETSVQVYFNQSECETKKFNEDLFYNAQVVVGIDYASTMSEGADFTCIGIRAYDIITKNVYDKKVFLIPEKFYLKKDDKEVNAVVAKSKHDELDYAYFIERGDMIVIKDARMITNQHVFDTINHLVEKYNLNILKIALDPSGLGEFQSKFIETLQDNPKFLVEVKAQQRLWNTPRIEAMKEKRAQGFVHNNNKLDEIQFANSITHENSNGLLSLDTLERSKRNDGVFVELCLETAQELFFNNINDDLKTYYKAWCIDFFGGKQWES